MKAVLPGRPEARLQALSTGYWDGRRIVVYATGNALAILADPDTLLQTIYDDSGNGSGGDDDDDNIGCRLDAVAFDEASGKIAASAGAAVRIYRPIPVIGGAIGAADGALKWALQTTFEIDDDEDDDNDASTPATLSWGSSEELLVGRGSLRLYDTTATPPSCHWRQRLASPAKCARLSHDSAYIASVGYRDRLVKVWRRLNFGFEEVRFEFGYLPHPRAVAALQWRQPLHPAQSTPENILYTFAADRVARVWTTGAPEGHGHRGFGCQNLRLWGQLDLVAAIRDVPSGAGQQHPPPPQQQKKKQKRKGGDKGDGGDADGHDDLRWAFIISQRDLAHATERAIQERGGEAGHLQKDDVALQYLISIANRDAEICVVLDGRGSMSAWALENVSAKTKGRQGTNIDNVAFVRSKDFEFLAEPLNTSTTSPSPPWPLPPPHVEILNYCNRSAGNLHLLIHRFDAGTVDLFEGSIADLLDPTFVRTGRLAPRATWSGHSAAVKKIVRNFSGHAIVSRTQQGGESIVWKHAVSHTLAHPHPHIAAPNVSPNAPREPRPRSRSSELLLSPKLIPEKRHIHRIALIRGGSFVVFLHHESIAVWDCRTPVPTLMAEHPYGLPGKPLCILVLPRLNRDDGSVAHIATITSERRGVVWEIHLPLEQHSSNPSQQDTTTTTTTNHQVNGHHKESVPSRPVLEEFCTFTLDDAAEDLAYVLPVDPAGAPPVISSGFLDVFARDVAVSYTRSGRVEFWTARLDLDPQRRRVEWLPTAAAETGIPEPALVSGSLAKKAALVNRDRSGVSIWDVRGARLEYYAHEGREMDREALDLDLSLAELGDHRRQEDATTTTTTTTKNTTATPTFATSTSTSASAPVQDLDWTSTPDSQSILAVGYPYRVVLLSELRFDYLNRGPAWAPVREINIRELTPHPIGDSAWLGGGHLVVGAGNQFFVYDRRFVAPASLSRNRRRQAEASRGNRPRSSNSVTGATVRDLFDVVQRLNGPLPVFHPQFLSQCILAAKNAAVKRVLMALYRALKFHVEGDEVDDYLGLDLAVFYGGEDKISTTRTNGNNSSRNNKSKGSRGIISFDDALNGSSNNQGGDDNDDDGYEGAFSEDIAASICEKLQTVALPQLSAHEQIQLVDIVECAGVVERQRRSMDENGARFMLFFRQHALLKHKAGRGGAGGSSAGGEGRGRGGGGGGKGQSLSWREITWAFHSDSQDVLADFVAKQYHGSMLWENARESGVFMWLADASAVKAQFEIIARNEYTKSELKNPVDCSLFYLALRKKAVLQGLWRMATWNKERVATQRLLANNFDDPKWKTTALKNAYALLSKRRFAYAAAFFLLADHLQDAVNVCLNQVRDLQLAIAIARVYGGDNGPVLKRLLEEEVLAIAAQEGNRWLASWAFWMLGRRDFALRALITPVYTLLETPLTPDPKSKLFLTDDPALVVLYAQLRDKTLQTLRGASKLTPRTEWEFVLHNARLYDRMGCDLLGLDLVRNWEFLIQQPPHTAPFGDSKEDDENNSIVDPRKLLRRGSSLVIADMPMSPTHAKHDNSVKTGVGGGAAAMAKPPPTVFEEPDASSLLDSFGF